MSDQLLVVLRVCLLVLVYLVFLRVLRAVWVELRAESPRRAAAPAPVAAGSGAAGPPSPAPSREPAPGRTAGGTGAVSRLQLVAPPALAGTSFTLDYALTDHLKARSEFRFDWLDDSSNGDGFFENDDGNSDNRSVVGVELVYSH